MKDFIADLHIHSKFSRATSKNLTSRNLAAWAAIKGIGLLATGDFTHPQWMEHITTELEQEESGLLRLKEQHSLEQELPWFSGQLAVENLRFILCTEISSIYKKRGKVRKIHNLVFMPDLEAAQRFTTRLEAVGNLRSDGRPILGLDARNLLEMVLETDPLAFVVPAHIWTPWFSLFGSKSGFDRLEDCFEDLSSEIFALETGLSSDPEMNWLWSALDRFTLISNSDAHSGEKLGREANLFSGEMSFSGVRSALRQKAGPTDFKGTIEFYPEEGKYHLDGHRKCNVVVEPSETIKLQGLCPVCGKELTRGVLSRIFELSDRPSPIRPKHQPGFSSLVPLIEVVSEIVGTGPKTKKAMTLYEQLIRDFGSELNILREIPVDALQKSSKILAEAVHRMRQGQVFRHSGYDGEYGRISMFRPEELHEFKHGRMFSFGKAVLTNTSAEVGQRWRTKVVDKKTTVSKIESHAPNMFQKAAIKAGPGPVLVLAGPGTGKTQTLLGRVRFLMDQGADPKGMVILTFTRKAARELKERLAQNYPKGAVLPKTDTIHALALEYWTQVMGEAPTIISEENARRLFAVANPHIHGKALKAAWEEQALARERGTRVPGNLTKEYLDHKARFNLVDYTDLLEFWMEHVELGQYTSTFDHVLVDEVQDLSSLQFNLVTALAGKAGQGFFAIGDPNQSIYAFRGAVRDVEAKLVQKWPDIKRIRLVDNYRSAKEILDLSAELFSPRPTLAAHQDAGGTLALFTAQNAYQEARWIGSKILELLGGTSHLQADHGQEGVVGPGDIAILVRLKALVAPIFKVLHEQGIPVSIPEEEPFFVDDRITLILRIASQVLGMPDIFEENLPACPEEIVEKGPLAMAVFFSTIPPFDELFWKSAAFSELVKAFQTFGGWQGVMNMVRLETELCAIRTKAQKVQIMTLHGAKGLEFDTVFLPGLEEGILPFAGMNMLLGKLDEEGMPDMEEERRLFYVGLTRAKRRLFISHSRSRKIFGKSLKLGLSSLVRQLPQDMLQKSTFKQHIRRSERQLSLF